MPGPDVGAAANSLQLSGHVLGMDEVAVRATDPLVGSPARGGPQRRRHPGDDPVLRTHDDVGGVLREQAEPLLGVAQRFARLHLDGDVAEAVDAADDAALGVAERGAGAAHPSPATGRGREPRFAAAALRAAGLGRADLLGDHGVVVRVKELERPVPDPLLRLPPQHREDRRADPVDEAVGPGADHDVG